MEITYKIQLFGLCCVIASTIGFILNMIFKVEIHIYSACILALAWYLTIERNIAFKDLVERFKN